MHALRTTVFRVLWPVITLLAIGAYGFYVWPTPYRYDHISFDGSTYPVRINRLNGEADMLMPDQGWVPVEGTEQPGTEENTRTTAAVAR